MTWVLLICPCHSRVFISLVSWGAFYSNFHKYLVASTLTKPIDTLLLLAIEIKNTYNVYINE